MVSNLRIDSLYPDNLYRFLRLPDTAFIIGVELIYAN